MAGANEHPEMECDNEFCINHKVQDFGTLSEWNKTKCTLFEIDPYEPGKNETGIRIDTCPARKRFKRMGW